MTYTEFLDQLMIALYQESQDEVDVVPFHTLTEKYGLESKAGWLMAAKDDLQADGLVSGPRHLELDDTALGKITGAGLRYVEAKYASKDGVGIILQPVEQKDAAPFDGDIFDPAIFDTDGSVDSTLWTGLPKQGTLTPEASQRLIEALNVGNDALERSGASNEEKAQARAYIVAIRALAEAPEPPADLIWQMIERLNSLSGIAALFVAIIGLFS